MSKAADIKGCKISARTLATQGRAAYLHLTDVSARIATGTFSREVAIPGASYVSLKENPQFTQRRLANTIPSLPSLIRKRPPSHQSQDSRHHLARRISGRIMATQQEFSSPTARGLQDGPRLTIRIPRRCRDRVTTTDPRGRMARTFMMSFLTEGCLSLR